MARASQRRVRKGARSTCHGPGVSPRWWPGGGADPGEGHEPDPRFTFANERTFLAWSRTALALVVAGLGIVQLLPPFPRVPVGRHLLGVPLIVLGAVLAIVALRRMGAQPARAAPRRAAAALGHAVDPGRHDRRIAVISAIVLLISALR